MWLFQNFFIFFASSDTESEPATNARAGMRLWTSWWIFMWFDAVYPQFGHSLIERKSVSSPSKEKMTVNTNQQSFAAKNIIRTREKDKLTGNRLNALCDVFAKKFFIKNVVVWRQRVRYSGSPSGKIKHYFLLPKYLEKLRSFSYYSEFHFKYKWKLNYIKVNSQKRKQKTKMIGFISAFGTNIFTVGHSVYV